MRRAKYVALISSMVTIISLFLPFAQSYRKGLRGDWIPGGDFIYVIQLPIGIVLLLIALIGGFMAYKELKYVFILGIINLIFGLTVFVVFMDGYHEIMLGLILFIVSSLVFTIFSAQFLNKNTEIK